MVGTVPSTQERRMFPGAGGVMEAHFEMPEETSETQVLHAH